MGNSESRATQRIVRLKSTFSGSGFIKERKEKDGKTEISYFPDALMPLKKNQVFSLPDSDMKIENQITSAFWVDIYIPKDAKAGETTIEISVLPEKGKEIKIPVTLTISPKSIPAEEAVTADHNTYGTGWLNKYFKIRKKTGGRLRKKVVRK